jgi:hypothetical protein
MDLQRERLTELIVHLMDCPPETALAAIDRAMVHPPSNAEESLEIVARAMVLLRRPVDLRDEVDLTRAADHDAKVGGRRSDHGAADSS